MKLLVVSDTHGNEQCLRQAIEQQPAARMVLHLGDGAREAQTVAGDTPDKPFYIVRGNCDWGQTLPEVGLIEVSGRRIFYTHGYRYQVKAGIYTAVCAAREQKADILLFGHTHEPFTEYEDGLYILNPGSLAYGRATYGLIEITPSGIMTNIVPLRR